MVEAIARQVARQQQQQSRLMPLQGGNGGRGPSSVALSARSFASTAGVSLQGPPPPLPHGRRDGSLHEALLSGNGDGVEDGEHGGGGGNDDDGDDDD